MLLAPTCVAWPERWQKSKLNLFTVGHALLLYIPSVVEHIGDDVCYAVDCH